MSAQSEPILNVPRVVIVLAVALIGVHVARSFLSEADNVWLLAHFAFIPIRYVDAQSAGFIIPGGVAADIWTFLSYALLHGDTAHLVINLVWLLAFGAPLAWRFGAVRFLVFSVILSAGGAAFHLFSHWGDLVPMVGASAIISGHMGAAMRFAFQPGAPLGPFRRRNAAAFRQPAMSLGAALSHPQVLMFLLVWFGINLVFGLGGVAINGEGAAIAWQAHIGGFVAGLALFALFDPISGQPPRLRDPYEDSNPFN